MSQFIQLLILFIVHLQFASAQYFQFLAGSNSTATSVRNVPSPRSYHTGTVDALDRVYIFGGSRDITGSTEVTYLGDLWRFNVATKTWTLLSDYVATDTTKPRAREASASWIDKSGNFWLYGGFMTGTFDDVWVYNTTRNAWRFVAGSLLINQPTTSTNPGARDGMGFWSDNQGRMYIFGGEIQDLMYSNVWRFDPTAKVNNWEWIAGSNVTNTNLPGQPPARWLTSCATDPDTSGVYAYCFGGRAFLDYTGQYGDLWRINMVTRTWELLNGNTNRERAGCINGRPGPRTGHSLLSSKLRGGLTLMFGDGYGLTCGREMMGELWHYHIASNTWKYIGKPDYYINSGPNAWPAYRHLPIGVALSNDNVVYVAGYGYSLDYSTRGNLNDAWLYRATVTQICDAGYYRAGNGLCYPCAAGTFAALPNSSICAVCSGGYFSEIGAIVCKICPVNTYSTVKAPFCLPCQSNTASLAGSLSCSCASGYELNNNNVCQPCQAGKFKDSIGNASCIDCPAGKWSNVNATVCLACPATLSSLPGSSTCSCRVGFGFNGTTCTPCEAGQFKSSIGNTSCTICPINSFSLPGAGSCIVCGENSVAEFGSNSCLCAAGHEPIGSLCSPCKSSTFKSAAGNTSCTPCQENTFSSKPGSTSCTSCGPFLVSAVGSASCVCPAGYFASGSGCVQCPSGTFKSTLGNETCKNCEANSFSGIGATVCTICGPNSVSGSGASECTCLYGHEPTGSYGCAPCAPGTAKQTIGNTPCNKCPAGQYSSGSGALVCLPCSQNTVSSLGSSSCSCNPGYEPSGSTCSQCSAGKVKASSGNSSCVDCPVDQYSLPGSTSCTVCGQNAFWNRTLGICTCLAGYYPNGNSCSPCSSGSFKSGIGNYTCTQCLPGFFQSGVASTQPCAPCDAGTYQDKPGQSICTQCKAGTYSFVVQGTSSSVCSYCPKDTFSEAFGAMSVATCRPCAANAGTLEEQGGNSSSSCVCKPGYEGTGSIFCSACPIDRFKDSFANANCLSCGVNAITNGQIGSTVCYCPNMFFGDPKVSCSRCPTGKVRMGLASSVTTELDCTIAPKCRAGTYGDPIESCIECPIDTYREGITELVTTVKDCKPCAQNSGTNGLTGAGSASQCLCFPGYFGSGAINTCAPCPANTFKATNNNTDACTLCPENSSTESKTGSTSINSCTCNTGYTGMASTGCTSCRPGSFKSTTGSGSCTLCYPGTYQSLFAQTSCLACLGNTYQSEFGKSSCVSCGVNAITLATRSITCYCPSKFYGDPLNSCSSCPDYYTRNGPSAIFTTKTDCIESSKCDAGFYGMPGVSCSKCPMDTYSPNPSYVTTTVDNCIRCPENATTNRLDGATSISQCICEAGYFGSTSSAASCQRCPVNTFKSKRGDASSCLACPQNSVAEQEGGIACKCNAGFFHRGADCLACPIGTFKSTVGDLGECTRCPSDTYSTLTGVNSVCPSCPAQLSTNGQEGRTSCDFCNAGYEGIAPKCTPCREGFVKKVVGNIECTPENGANNQNNEGGNNTALIVALGGVVTVGIMLAAMFAIIQRSKKLKEEKRKEADMKQSQQQLYQQPTASRHQQHRSQKSDSEMPLPPTKTPPFTTSNPRLGPRAQLGSSQNMLLLLPNQSSSSMPISSKSSKSLNQSGFTIPSSPAMSDISRMNLRTYAPTSIAWTITTTRSGNVGEAKIADVMTLPDKDRARDK